MMNVKNVLSKLSCLKNLLNNIERKRMRPKKKFSKVMRNGVELWRARFHELEDNGYIPKRDLATVQEVLIKKTARGSKQRSDIEQANELNRLYEIKRDQIIKGTEKKPDRSFSGITDEWLDFVAKYRDEKTASNYKRTRDIFLEAMRKDEKPEPKHFTRFTEELKSRGIVDESVNSYLRELSAFFGWAHEQGIYFNEDKRKVTVKMLRTTLKEMGIYTDEQIEAIRKRIEFLLAEARDDRKIGFVNEMRVFCLVNLTGMRGGEIHSLKLADINIGESTIRIRDCKITGFRVKGRREESVPINNELAKFLVADLTNRNHGEKWYLDAGDGSLMWKNENEMSKRFKRHQIALNIKGVKPVHGFRATVCTKLLKSGMSPVKVQNLLRHRRLETTLKYLNTSVLSAAEVVEGLTISGHELATTQQNPSKTLKSLAG